MEKTLARYGDCSTSSKLCIEHNARGVVITCQSDKPSKNQNLIFYEKDMGGNSSSTYEALFALYLELPLDKDKFAFLTSASENGNRLLLTRKNNVISVKTVSKKGLSGVDVTIRNESPMTNFFINLIGAIEIDNMVEPDWNALA